MALENESMRANLLNPPEMMNLGHDSVGWSLCGLRLWTYIAMGENTKTNIPKRWADEMAALPNYSHIVSLPLVLLTFIYVSSLLVGGYVEQDEISFDIFRPADESMTMKSTQVWSRNLPFWNLLPFNGGCGNHMRCTCMALAWLWAQRSGTGKGKSFWSETFNQQITLNCQWEHFYVLW